MSYTTTYSVAPEEWTVFLSGKESTTENSFNSTATHVSNDQNLNHTCDSPNSFSGEHFQQPENEVSMIRTILNPTPNSVEIQQVAVLNNNDQNCNHNSTTSTKVVESVARDVLQDVQSDPSIESILCEAIKLEFEAYSSLTHFHGNSRELNDAERAKLNELIVANKSLLAPVDDDFQDLMTDDFQFNVSNSLSLRYEYFV